MVRSNIPTEATVQNVQNLSQGGIGQQNIPQGGTNMFNAGEFVITGEHATVNFDSHESYLRGLFTLGQIDPVSDKRSIERRKGGLLRQSYQWILSNADFKRWRQDPDVGLLWIRGDPGKGKTMLLCGVIDELSRQKSQGEQNLAFFFCLDERRDDAVGVVRGLLASLFVQQPDIRRSYETRFRGQPPLNVTSWEVLREVMEGVFRDPRLRETCIIIDALDECRHGLWDLLALISRMPSPRIKFLLASRSSDRIQQALKVGTAVGNRLLSLELNSEAISEAVYSYIEHRLAGYEGYDAALKQEARQYLQKNSGSTFLWVALVIQELATDRTPRWKLGSLLDRLRAFPSSLEELYKRIWSNMLITHENEDVDVDTRRSLCPRILALVLTVERPVSLTEASLLIDWPADFPINDLARQEAIGYCRSFVTIGVDDKVIHMVHQSAKDFLLKHAVGMLFPSGAAFHHLNIAQVSLMVISKTLHEGMRPPANRKDRRRSASAPSQQKSVDAATYSCLYWVDHLQLGLVAQPKKVQHQYLKDGGPVHVFLQTHLLHWFEFIALHGAVSTGITALSTLITLSTAILPVDT
ncbi:NACHT domain-containing protein, partial [Plectosphaerella plurivora]